MRFLPAASVAGAVLLFACSKPSGGDAPAGSAATTGSSAPAATGAGTGAAPGGATKTVDLTPLPLTIKMPKDEAANTMDKTMGDHKSVGVSYDAILAGINVSDANEKNFDGVKKQFSGDKVMYPFKRWVSETPTQAVEEFVEAGKSGFIALSWKTIGGKNYLCQSAGMSGLKSADDAQKVFAICDTLAAK